MRALLPERPRTIRSPHRIGARLRRWPAPIRFLAGNAALGALVGVVMVAGILGFDVGGLASLLAHAEQPLLLTAVMTVQFAAGFATFAVVTAVFLIPSAAAPSETAHSREGHRHSKR